LLEFIGNWDLTGAFSGTLGKRSLFSNIAIVKLVLLCGGLKAVFTDPSNQGNEDSHAY
jgi:hypothetical protein